RGRGVLGRAAPETEDRGAKAVPTAGAAPRSREEEAHLHARELNDVVVVQLARLRADRGAVHERKALARSVLDVHDEVAFRAARDRRDLDTRPAERRQRLRERELAAGERAGEHLQLRERQGRRGGAVLVRAGGGPRLRGGRRDAARGRREPRGFARPRGPP